MKRIATGGQMDIHAKPVGQVGHELWLKQFNPYTGEDHETLYITSKQQAQELVELLQGWINASPEQLTQAWLQPDND